MNWRFWQPRQTVASVAGRLAEGLRDGSVVLDEPFADEAEDAADDDLMLNLNAPAGSTDLEMLDLIKRVTLHADEGHRQSGGHGLSIQVVWFSYLAPAGKPAVRVRLRPKNVADRPELLRNVLAILRQRSDLPLAAD
jgi:hypothetical protein